MIAARIVAPHTKLATTRQWHSTTLAQDFGVADADEDDLYGAMDWLLAHQDPIQKKLAACHLREGGLVLYDLSSSYFEGLTCPLAKLGYSRDGRKGLLQVNYGLFTDARGARIGTSRCLGLFGRVGCPACPGFWPLREENRDPSLRASHRPGHEARALPIRPAGVLDHGQRLLAPRSSLHQALAATLAHDHPGAYACARQLAEPDRGVLLDRSAQGAHAQSLPVPR